MTNLPGWLVSPLLDATGIKKYAAAIATPKAGVRAKPQPDGICKVLAEMGRNADSETWYIGDTTVDAKAAKSAAMRFAWASFGYESAMPPGTDKLLNSFGEILHL